MHIYKIAWCSVCFFFHARKSEGYLLAGKLDAEYIRPLHIDLKLFMFSRCSVKLIYNKYFPTNEFDLKY